MINSRNIIKLVTLFLTFSLIVSCSSGSSANSNSKILVITDIHFDPYNSCGTSPAPEAQACVANLIRESNPASWHFSSGDANSFGEETNYAFLSEGLNNLKKLVITGQVDKIFVTGDLLSHNFPAQFESYVPNGSAAERTTLAINTMNYVMYQISQAVPERKMYYVFGNNDTDNADYAYPSQDFMTRITSTLAPYMANPESFSSTFAGGGYYIMPLNASTDVIGLNFNPLTVENSGNNQDLLIAESQLIWLKEQLATERKLNKRVIILQHEPFGMNLFNIIESKTPVYNLVTELQDEYLELYKQYNDLINNYYYGHYHMEDIQIGSNIFAFSTLGFSVDYYNNPGFKILSLNSLGQLQNYTTFYSQYESNNLLEWSQLYQLNSTYNITPANYVSYFQTVIQPESSNVGWNRYVSNYSGNNYLVTANRIPIVAPSSWQVYYCGINYLDSDAFNLCLQQ